MTQNWICLYCGQEFGPYMNRCLQHAWNECLKRRQLPPVSLADVQRQIAVGLLRQHAELSRN